MDWSVVAFALGLSLLTGLMCGLVPARRSAPRRVQALRSHGLRSP